MVAHVSLFEVCVHECNFPERPEEGAEDTGAGVIDSCGSGNQTLVLRKRKDQLGHVCVWEIQKSVLLTIEPSLQPQAEILNICIRLKGTHANK